MAINKIISGTAAAVVNVGTEAIVAIVQISLLWAYLKPPTVGLWMIFLPAAGLFLAIGAAVSQAVSRQQAAICANSNFHAMTLHFMRTTKVVFLVAAATNIFISLLIHHLYFSARIVALPEHELATFAWGLLVSGYCLRLLGLRYVGHLNGYGVVGKDKLLQAICALLILCCTYLFLISGLGLLGAGLAHLIGGAVFFAGSWWLLRKKLAGSRAVHAVENKAIRPRDLLREASGFTLMSVVAWMLTSSDVFIVEYLFGLETVSRYAALTKIALLIAALSVLVPQMAFPFIAKAWTAQNHSEARRLVRFTTLAGPTVAVVCSIMALAIAPFVIPIWLRTESAYLGPGIFSMQLLFALLYSVHVSHVSATLATGVNPFVVAAVLNVGLSLPLALVLGHMFGMLGVPIGYTLGTLPVTIFAIYSTQARFSLQAAQRS